MDELNFFDRITECGLTPNEYFTLKFLVSNQVRPSNFNLDVEARKLSKKGFLDEKRRPTNLVVEKNIFPDIKIVLPIETQSDIDSMNFFINLFPPIKIPPYYHLARQPITAVEKRFREFFNRYDYKWDIIFEATERYLLQYSKNNYLYMKNCANFVFNGESSILALECEAVINEKPVNIFSTDI